MAYSGVYVFGDSLVDAGNALKLAQFYGNLTASEMPDGAPTAEQGYYLGRFSNGYTFADLISNKTVAAVTKPIFPYGYEYNGVPISPWSPDPSGNNLNFAYGGAQVRQGEEVVPDLDGQTDAFKDAVDNRPDPNALYIFTMGGNDVRSLARAGSDPADPLTAEAALRECAQQLIHEISQLIALGVRNIVITGVPDVGLIPKYDDAPGMPGYGALEGEEIARSEAATRYSQFLDELIQDEVVPALIDALVAQGVSRADAEAMVHYIQIMDHTSADGTVTSTGALSAVTPTLEYLHGLPEGELAANPFAHQEVIFFDRVHPNAQTHALIGAYMQADITNSAWVETMPLLGADVDFARVGTIGVAGEIDGVSIALVAGSTYTFQLLGVSSLTPYVLGQLGLGSLPTGPILADPSLRLLSGSGVVIRADDDSGAGFDSSLVFDVTTAGTYTLQMLAVGAVTGSYVLTATVTGAAMGDNSYNISNASTLVIEAVGGGTDTVNASVSYALAAGSEVELLQTSNARGKGSINLTGNDFAQKIVGNVGSNVLEGKGGSDEFWGGAGNDRFVLSKSAVLDRDGSEIDRIMDYAKGDVVDITQILAVASGVNAVSAGYLRVTTGGLIQVDLDGSAGSTHGWVTLSTVNGTGAVSVRYLSGGTATTVSVGRVAETQMSQASAANTNTVMVAAVAAAGVMSAPAAAETAPGAQQDLWLSASGHLDGSLSLPQRVFDSLAEGFALVAEAQEIALQSEAESPGSLSRAQVAEQLDLPAAEAAVAQSAPTLLHSSDSPVPGAVAAISSFVADAVAMPSAEMLQSLVARGAARADVDLRSAGNVEGEAQTTSEVSRVLVDALGGGRGGRHDIDDLLEALAAGGDARNAVEAFAGRGSAPAEGMHELAVAALNAHSPFAADSLVVHHDAAPTG